MINELGGQANIGAERRLDPAAVTRSVGAARQAGYLFLAAAAIGTVNDFLPNSLGEIIPQSLNLCVGIAALIFAPSRFFQGRATLVPVFAIANVSLANGIGALPPVTYGIWFVLIFLWVGTWYRQAVVFALAPVAVAAYLAPLLAGRSESFGAIPSVLIVVPVAVTAGLSVAHYAQRVKASEEEWQRLLNELSHTSMTDALTGLGNRRLGDLLLQNLEPGDGVVLLDLDRFKAVNDRFGHPEGDRLLRELADFLHGALRVDDTVARVGGEEFLIVMRGVGDGVLMQTQRLVKAWSSRGPLTSFSAGVAVHRKGVEGAATYAEADEALYAAKKSRRNRAIKAA